MNCYNTEAVFIITHNYSKVTQYITICPTNAYLHVSLSNTVATLWQFLEDGVSDLRTQYKLSICKKLFPFKQNFVKFFSSGIDSR